MKNKEWLSTLDSENFYDEFMEARQSIFLGDISSRTRGIIWLDEEFTIAPTQAKKNIFKQIQKELEEAYNE